MKTVMIIIAMMGAMAACAKAPSTTESGSGVICNPCNPDDPPNDVYVESAIAYGQSIFADAVGVDAWHAPGNPWENTCVTMETDANPFDYFKVTCGLVGNNMQWHCSWSWGICGGSTG